MTQTNSKQWTPATWQTDPNSIDASLSRIQYWSREGGMVTAQMSVERAKELVAEGKAFVMTGQAIGAR